MDSAFDIIRAYVTAHWLTTPVAWPNEQFDKPEPQAPWIIIDVAGGDWAQESVGAGKRTDELWREIGQLVAHVAVPSGTGTAEARRIARAFADLFRGQDIQSLTFVGASIGMGSGGDDDGAWFLLPLSLDWQRDE